MIIATGRNTGEALSILNKLEGRTIRVNVAMHLDPKFTTRYDAESASLAASVKCLDASPLDPFAVAVAVGKEAALREQQFDKAHAVTAPRQSGKTAALLGCYVNGVLKFQSRDHEAIHDYAADKATDFRNNVWVAPIGSFVDSKAAAAVDKRAMRKVKAA